MLSSIDISRIKSNISSKLNIYASISPARALGILPIKDLQGKLYEAHVLAELITKLVIKEGYLIKLIHNGTLTLKQKGSPINRNYPYFEVWDGSGLVGEIFTDTEFTSLSHNLLNKRSLNTSDYHELDIVMLKPSCSERPDYRDVLLAIECKATAIEKSTFREILGFRRELALLANNNFPTRFKNWPILSVPSQPPSVYMCYSTDPAILKYKKNASIYGIIMVHEKM